MKSNHRSILLIALMAVPFGGIQAAYSVLSGQFLGDELTIINPAASCVVTQEPLAHSTIKPITVTATGTYLFASLYFTVGIDVFYAIYEMDSDPANPEANPIAILDWVDWIHSDLGMEAELHEGVKYQLVVAPLCRPKLGTWALAVRGPGEMYSPATRHGLDPITAGTFSGDGPVADIGCDGAREYMHTGPHRVLRSGRYFLIDGSYWFYQAMCAHVFTAAFDAANPAANRIVTLNGSLAEVDLVQGRDYYFVVQPRTVPGVPGSCCKNLIDPQAPREYFFLLAPSSDIYLDSTFSGNWYDPAKPGQGFFLEFYPGLDRAFLGWFTFELQRPASSVQAQLGDPGHRWLTALGEFGGNEAAFAIEVTRGGAFNSASPAPQQTLDGELLLTMHSCTSGTIQFDLGSAGRTGEIPIERLVPENAGPCDSQLSAAALPRRVLAD